MSNSWTTLRDVQKVQLEILLEFDRICRKHGLKYLLFAGTLLGAVRHKGFIPWDDDIDVCMLRGDYERFLTVCKDELSAELFLQTTDTDREYPLQFAKLRKNNTRFVEKSMSDLKIHHGVFIDIFPLDNVMPHSFIGRFQQISLYVLHRINLTRVPLCQDSCRRFLSKV